MVEVLVVGVMLVVGLVGCNEMDNAVAEAEISMEPESVISEPVSEPVSEEVSEVVSEEVVSEEETVNKIEVTNFSNYSEFLSHLEKLNRTMIVVWKNSEQFIMPNGVTCELNEGDKLIVYYVEGVNDIKSSADYIEFSLDKDNAYQFMLNTTGTEIEVPITVTYEDGTVEELVVYITKDWKYSWEE